MHCDIAIINANIRTMVTSQRHHALGIAGQTICAMGDNDTVMSGCGSQTHIIDAHGATVMPGFVESHMHLFFGAHSSKVLKLHDIQGTQEISEKIRAFAANHPDHSLLIAQGVNYNAFDGGADADRHVLDKICADRPILLQSADFHNGWANTAALTAVDALHGREFGDGSRIEIGSDGMATGVLTELAAVSCVQALGAHGGRDVLGLEGKEPSTPVTPEDRAADKALIREGLACCAKHGITTIINMDGNLYQAELLRAIEQDGDLTCRVELPFNFSLDDAHACMENAEKMRRELNSDMLWCNRVKFFMDGVLDMSTAYRLQDYPEQPDQRGAPLYTPETFLQLAVELDKRDFQIAVHAIGDAAVRTVLDGYEAAFDANGQRGNRHRVEHIELLDPADLPRFTQLEVVASMMPQHPPGCEFPLEPTVSIIGQDQWPDAYQWRTLKDSGAHLCFSSDWPIAELSPLTGIQTAMNRQPWDAQQKDERLSFEETLAAYTFEGAYACRREDWFGSLQVGHAADIVVLDTILSPETVSTAKVATTICNGEITYQI